MEVGNMKYLLIVDLFLVLAIICVLICRVVNRCSDVPVISEKLVATIITVLAIVMYAIIFIIGL